MTDIAIRVENLSKLYTIGLAQQRHDTPSTPVSYTHLTLPTSDLV